MSKIFGTIAVVLLAAGAFIAHKNQEAYKKEIVTHQGEEATKKSTTEEYNGQVTLLKVADEARQGEVDKEASVAKVLDEVSGKFDAEKKKVANQKNLHQQNETEIASAEEALKGLPDPGVLIPKIKRMTSELTQATSGIASEEAKLANLVSNDANGKARIKVMRDRIAMQTTGRSFPDLKTSIRSVYRNWGFVILTSGDKQGVISGSTLDVVRGGEVIAKLKVTAVESGTAAADIVLNSVTEGTEVRSGDKVVPEKEQAQLANDAAAAIN